MLAAFKFFGGSHKPVHLQVHGPEQVIKWPNHPWPHRIGQATGSFKLHRRAA